MSIDWSKAPEGATHSLIKDSGVAWFKFKDDLSFPNTWKDGEWKNVRLPTRELTPKPAPKRLTQAVFDGLPPEYRWAAISSDGRAHAHKCTPKGAAGAYWWCVRGCAVYLIGEGYDTTDWQNSLIERPKKRLTQAVFDGLPPEYRWAAVDNRGSAYAFNAKPKPFKSDFRDWDFNNVDTISLGVDYDTTDWRNSLIERQDVNSRVEQLRSIEEARQVEQDPVNSPSHYTTGGIECIDAMQAMLSRDEFIGYLRGNVFKYQWRYQHKNGVEDLKKAQWYANRLIELEQSK